MTHKSYTSTSRSLLWHLQSAWPSESFCPNSFLCFYNCGANLPYSKLEPYSHLALPSVQTGMFLFRENCYTVLHIFLFSPFFPNAPPFYLFPFSQFTFYILVCMYVCHNFILLWSCIKFHCVYAHFFLHSSVHVYLDWVHIMATIINAAINMDMQVPLWGIGNTPKNYPDRSCDSSNF